MGNSMALSEACSAFCIRASKSKSDNKVSGLMKVEIMIKGLKLKRIPANLPITSTCFLGNNPLPLPDNREAKTGDRDKSECPGDDSGSKETTTRQRRIKVVISKKQLKMLLAKQISVEQVISEFRRTKLASLDVKWKPRLESVPEGNEQC